MSKSTFALRSAAVFVAAAWIVLVMSSDFFARVSRERVLIAFGHARVSAPLQRTVLASDCAECEPVFRATPVVSISLRTATSGAVVAVVTLLFVASWRDRKRLAAPAAERGR